MIRTASDDDVEAMLDLAEQRRQQYASYHPTFHRPAADAREAQRHYFHQLVASGRHIVLVHQQESLPVDGFITGQIFPPPPVYDPGGPGCLVDDFVVSSAERWATVGRELVDELAIRARSHGAVQLIVVCAPEDRPKYELLRNTGLKTISEWLLREL